jgi:hypothetical protein
MRRLALVVMIVAAATLASAVQPTPRVQWTHDGVGVTRFEIVIDKGTPVDVGLPTPEGQTYTTPLPTVSAGSHVLVVRACNSENVCALSVPLRFVQS